MKQWLTRSVVAREKTRLRSIKGEGDRSVFLNDYLPQQLNEQKKRERQIKSKCAETNIKVEHTNKGLLIGSSLYRKKVHAPKPEDLLDIEPEELDQILDLPTTSGEKIRIKDSIFIAYAADAKNYSTIRQAYQKVRLLHAQARHVVCSYTIPGQELHYCQDFDDDGDHGVGRTLLEGLIQNKIECKAIYVVRFCGREKLGQERFDGYLKAVENLFKKSPRNQILQQDQTFMAKYPKPEIRRKKTRTQPSKDGDVEPNPQGTPQKYTPQAMPSQATTTKKRDKSSNEKVW